MLEAAWMGRRVVLRQAVPTSVTGGVRYRDVLGDLVALGPLEAQVLTRSGRVSVPLDAVASARLVQPAAAAILALEAAASRGWRAQEMQVTSDGWLCRADRGWTGRANSALALRTVRRPLDDVLGDVQDWYAARDLPARIQVPEPAGSALAHALDRRGWPGQDHTDVLVSRLDPLIGPVSRTPVEVRLDPAPDENWLAGYHYRGRGPLPASAYDLLTRHDRVIFARVTVDATVVAIGRGAVDGDWLGLTAIDVAPSYRRQGLAAGVVDALARWGSSNGAVRAYAQSDQANDQAHRLFDRLGFHAHHSYHYRSAPTID